MNKNVLIVTATYFPDLGGAGIVAKNTSEELLKSGYNVIVFCGGKTDKTEEINKVKVIRNNNSKNNSPCILNNYYYPIIENKFLKIIKENDIGIVHFHSIQGLGANLIKISLDKDIKTVLTMHDFWWECPMLFLNDEYLSSRPIKNHQDYCNSSINQKFLNKRKKYFYEILKDKRLTITTVSKTMKKTLEYIGLPNASKYICIENGLNKNYPKNDLVQKRSNSKTQFAYFGGENLSKGFDLVIKASKYLKFNTNNFQINLYGIHRPKLKTFINYRFLKKYHIKLNDIYRNEDLPKIFSKIDIVLVPSRMYESFSLIAREALINDKIIISSGMGGLSELSNKRHLLFNKNSSADLAKKMFYAMNNLDNLKKNKDSIVYVSLEEQSKLYQKLYNNEI